ncbi:MAG: hypothetical protein U1F10_15170 [Burkholderiales bacterium]
MADFPAPQSASGVATPVGAGVLAYALFGIGAVLEIARSGIAAPAPFLTLIGIVAVIVCYVKRDDAAGTWVASHFAWLIRTFWWSLAWGAIGWILFWLGIIGSILILPLALVGIAAAIWIVCAIWVLYRVIRGYLLYKDSRPIPGF